jgi:hypothetical protein
MDYVHHRGRTTSPDGDETIVDGGITYERWSAIRGHNAVWVHFPTKADGVDPFDLGDRALKNPIGLLGFVTSAGDNVREIGTDTVRGTTTTHYEGTLNFQKVVDHASPDQRAALQQYLNFLSKIGPTDVPFDLWVDANGVTHRLRMDQGNGSVMVEFYDFGIPVEITAPPIAETVGTQELFSELLRHSGDPNCSDEHVNAAGVPTSQKAEGGSRSTIITCSLPLN